MAVRRQCNRYKTEPFGRDFEDVLARAKRFFKDETFMIAEYKGIYSSSRPSAAFKNPSGARVFQKDGRRWREVTQ